MNQFISSAPTLAWNILGPIPSFKNEKFKIFDDGDVYKGQMTATGIKSGFGTIIHKSKGVIYMGSWKND